MPKFNQKSARWLGAAAVAALMAGGAIEGGFVAPNPAQAELRSLSQPIAMPSFADVIERVKPAVVSVRVKIQNAAERQPDFDGSQFQTPDLPPGHPLERFFREFREQQPGGPRQGPEQHDRRVQDVAREGHAGGPQQHERRQGVEDERGRDRHGRAF